MNEIVEAKPANPHLEYIKEIANPLSFARHFFTVDNLAKVLVTVTFLIILFVIYRILTRTISTISSPKFPKRRAKVVTNLLRYIYYTICVIYILGLFGIKLKAIWGAAGVAGIAIGFAAQTSVSNLISGLFVMTEGAFHVDDQIEIDGLTIIVDEIKLLSIHGHTFNNQMVRIPNSDIISNIFINNTHQKKRRITLAVSIAYESDAKLALQTLSKAAKSVPTVLSDPEPKAWIESFGDSGVNLTVAVWFKTADLVDTRTNLIIAILDLFKEEGIEIPYNKIQLVDAEEEPEHKITGFQA